MERDITDWSNNKRLKLCAKLTMKSKLNLNEQVVMERVITDWSNNRSFKVCAKLIMTSKF